MGIFAPLAIGKVMARLEHFVFTPCFIRDIVLLTFSKRRSSTPIVPDAQPISTNMNLEVVTSTPNLTNYEIETYNCIFHETRTLLLQTLAVYFLFVKTNIRKN